MDVLATLLNHTRVDKILLEILTNMCYEYECYVLSAQCTIPVINYFYLTLELHIFHTMSGLTLKAFLTSGLLRYFVM
jgi:hypothetical protein